MERLVIDNMQLNCMVFKQNDTTLVSLAVEENWIFIKNIVRSVEIYVSFDIYIFVKHHYRGNSILGEIYTREALSPFPIYRFYCFVEIYKQLWCPHIFCTYSFDNSTDRICEILDRFLWESFWLFIRIFLTRLNTIEKHGVIRFRNHSCYSNASVVHQDCEIPFLW